jgi:MarR-like DNA-binding transcriptional regulator SgrR of sgrS sRNA
MCGVSNRQVRNLVQDLQAKGLISVEHRPGRGRGRKPNVYRLEMVNRQSVTACLEGQPETGNRKPTSGNAVPNSRRQP